MTFIVITGEFDISVGSVMALSGVVVVSLINSYGLAVAILALIAIGFIVGLINSLLVIKVKINSFIATLGGMIFYRGIAFLITKDGTPVLPKVEYYNKISTGTLLNIPFLVYIFFIIVIISEFILKKTTFGRNIYSTGCNYEVAKFAGVNVVFYKTAAFIICSTSAALAGLLMSSRLNTAAPIAADDAALSALSAVVLGGTSLSGGTGNALKTLVGLMILGLIVNALNMVGISSYIQLAIKGTLLILFVSMERYFQNRAQAVSS